MKKRGNGVNTEALIPLYIEAHLTVRAIGALVGMSGQGVSKRLHKAGITRDQGERVARPCSYCGVVLSRPRSRSLGLDKVYCCAGHYYAARANPDFFESRQGSRLARAIVSQHYPLTSDEVVHHKNGDQRHNDLANLVVYASQSDHMAMHHGKRIEPVWDGADTTLCG